MRQALALLLALAAPLAAAGDAEERARIHAERRETETRFNAELAACSERFVVTACQDEVRARKREALALLRSQELLLDDAERKRRAADRMRQIEKKRIDAESRPAAPPEPELRVPRAAASAAAPASSASRPHLGRVGDDPAQAARRAAAAERVREQAAEDRARIEQRKARRAQAGKPPAALPVPPEAAASR